MNIYEMIEFLQEQPNKELDVIMRAEAGWFSVCSEDSKEQEFEGDKFFVLNPCYGHNEETREFKAKDYKIEEN